MDQIYFTICIIYSNDNSKVKNKYEFQIATIKINNGKLFQNIH